MYLKLGLGLLLVGALYGVSQLPDYYRNQGAKAERILIEKEIAQAVEKETAAMRLRHVEEKLVYEIKYQESRDEYAKELRLTRDNYDKSSRLLFNKNKICSNPTGGNSKTEGGSGSDDRTTGEELFPEPYATDIKELMLEADLNTDKIRALQKVIKESSCLTVVSNLDKAKE